MAPDIRIAREWDVIALRGMKAMEKMRNIKRLKWFVMSFIVFVVVFGALHCGVALLARMRQSGVMVYLLSIHRLLERDVETSGKPEPTRFSPVRRSKQEYYLKDADTYYYPQAWNKPGRILLTHRCGAVEYVIFGHIGENHLHFNFFPKNDGEKERANTVYVEAVKRAVKAGGTISAEHGIGKLKHKYLEMMYGKEGIMEMPWQYFAVLIPVKSVGVHGDKRAYGYVIAVRSVHSIDAMTCAFSKIPNEVMDRISTRITNTLKDKINRVVYDVTNKPPGTVEWE